MNKDRNGDTFLSFFKRLIAVLLLLGCAYFMYLQQASLTQIETEVFPYLNAASQEQEHPYIFEDIDILGNHVVTQEFQARGNKLGVIKLYFHKEGGANSTGTVILRLKDSSQKVIAETSMDAKYVKNARGIKFLFGADSASLNQNRIISTVVKADTSETTEVKEGETYYLELESKNVQTDGRFTLMTARPGDGAALQTSLPTVVADGEAQEGRYMRFAANYRFYDKSLLLRFGLILLMALFLICLPLRRMSNLLNRATGLQKRSEERLEAGKRAGFTIDFDRFCIRCMFFLTPFVCYFLIGRIANQDIVDCLKMLPTIRGKLNMLIIGMVWWVVYTIVNRTKPTIILTTLLAFGFGFINYVLRLFRDSPLFWTDIENVGTAMDVTKSYVVTYDRASLWAILITVVWIALALVLRDHKGFPLKLRIIPLIICIAWCGCFYYTFFKADTLKEHQLKVSSFKPAATYRENGYALSFVITWKNSIVEKPEGYSEEKVREITKNYVSDEAVKQTETTEKAPNVIVIMNESFSDLNVLGDFDTNKDFMPFYRSIKKNAVKGWMHSSVFGGSTADTEFEYLTGNSMRFLPYHSVPYRSIIKDPIPNFTTSMKAQGYGGNIAFHPGMADSYNRNNVYPNLGFNQHISLEDLDDAAKIRDYVSDSYDYKVLEQNYEEYRKNGNRNPFYFFNVTIQNHAGYTLAGGKVDGGIEITSTNSKTEQAEQFLNLMKKSDEALEELITYFKKVEEPTVIVLFGDHQPRVEGSFYDSLDEGVENAGSLAHVELRYHVPFMIWANYDIEEQSDVELSANYFGAYTKQVIGLNLTGYDKYLLDLHEKLPSITSVAYIDAEGNVYNPDEPSDYDPLIKEYQMIQYNGLIDGKHRVEEFFNLQ